FLHHMNGQGKPRGSKAFRGIVDIELLFHRGKKNTFTINSVSRFASVLPPKMGAELVKDAKGWFFKSLEGSRRAGTREARPRDTDALLREALAAAGGTGLTYGEIDRIEGLSSDKAKKRFPAWYEESKIDKHGEGRKGNPTRWFLPAA